MKILTANFVTCAVKACKSSPDSFPLHFRDAELEQVEMEYNPAFIRNIMPRVEWEALKITAGELGFTTLPTTKPESTPELSSQPETSTSPSQSQAAAAAAAPSEDTATDTAMTTDPSNSTAESSLDPASTSDKLWHDLHTLLLETHVVSGKMVCGSCGHEYRIRDGIANFLLPNHLV